MATPTQSFQTMVSNAVAAIQGATTQLIDLTVGAVLRAFVDAFCLLALWLQGIALYVASLTRASTSNGPDLDSWMADFNFPRLAATEAEGPVTFSRFTPTNQATIAVGTLLTTSIGGIQFSVIADTTQSAYNSTLNAYVIAAGTTSCTATVEAVVAGTSGNVQAGLITTINSTIPGVDTVTNATAFSNAANAESDTAYRARFQLYIGGLSEATLDAIETAIESVQQGIYYSITANYNYAGVYTPGYFYVVIDDGTGSPPSSLITAVSNAIAPVRGFTISYGVFAVSPITTNVSMGIIAAAGYSLSVLDPIVESAIQTFINTLNVGATLPYTKLAQIAYDATPGVAEVSPGYTVNGGTTDIAVTNQQAARSGTVSIT